MRRLARTGVRIELFLTVREGETTTNYDQSSADFEFCFLSVEDIGELVQLDPQTGAEELREWFKSGKLCFGARTGEALVAKTWCDLDTFNYPPNYRMLADDEAYLYAASTHPDHRGKNLAPKMRSACYEALRKMGRHRFYSYTDYFNTPARRFKKKLGAREQALRIHIDLFGKWSKTMTLRKFRHDRAN